MRRMDQTSISQLLLRDGKCGLLNLLQLRLLKPRRPYRHRLFLVSSLFLRLLWAIGSVVIDDVLQFVSVDGHCSNNHPTLLHIQQQSSTSSSPSVFRCCSHTDGSPPFVVYGSFFRFFPPPYALLQRVSIAPYPHPLPSQARDLCHPILAIRRIPNMLISRLYLNLKSFDFNATEASSSSRQWRKTGEMSQLEFASPAPGRILGNIGGPLKTLDDDDDEGSEYDSPTDVGSSKEKEDETGHVIENVHLESQDEVRGGRGAGDRSPASCGNTTAAREEVCTSSALKLRYLELMMP